MRSFQGLNPIISDLFKVDKTYFIFLGFNRIDKHRVYLVLLLSILQRKSEFKS